MGETTPSSHQHQHPLVSPFPTPRAMPVREDCWSEDATATLINAWGQRYVDLNRGNLRQKQWQEVADTVNARHGQTLKSRRTDVQCKNRIDTLKKKYKVEKARIVENNGNYKSPWVFFETLDWLIAAALPIKMGSGSPSLSMSPPIAVPLVSRGSGSGNGNNVGLSNSFGGHVNMNMRNMSAPTLGQKRPAVSMTPVVQGEGHFRRNYAELAAAAARVNEESEEESEEEEVEEVEREEEEGEGEEMEGDGIRKLARVIEKFGEVYARVEREKQKQLIELEKQRMQFAKELECQRMQILVEMQVQLEKFKHAKRSNSDDMYS